MIKLLSMTLASSICLASCTVLLIPKYQKVQVTTPSTESKLYCNDSLIGTGKTLTLRLRRSHDMTQLRVETKGYRDINTAIFPRKLNFTPLLNIPIATAISIPIAPLGEEEGLSRSYTIGIGVASGAVVAYTEMFEGRAKGYKPIIFGEQLQIERVSRKEQQKNLMVEEVALNIPKGGFVANQTHRGRQNGTTTSRVVLADSTNISNTVFTMSLNHELVKCNFLDTADAKLFKSAAHQLNLRAEITKINTTEDKSATGSHANRPGVVAMERMHSTITTKWKIVDGYGDVKFDTTITTTSGVFAARPDTSKTNRHTLALLRTIDDALGISMHTLLRSSKAQQLLISTDGAIDTPKDILSITKTTVAPKDLEEAITACVTIGVRLNTGEKAHGSGFFISQDGYIITNYHVVTNAANIEVINSDDKKFTATLVRKNKIADLALLKIDATLPYAFDLPTTKNYNVGMDVYAVGTPSSQELGQTISKGIISGDRKGEAGNDVIQTDVSVSGGNSGGALINKEIKILGVVNAKLVGIGVEGIAFAIPAKDIAELLNLNLK